MRIAIPNSREHYLKTVMDGEVLRFSAVPETSAETRLCYPQEICPFRQFPHIVTN